MKTATAVAYAYRLGLALALGLLALAPAEEALAHGGKIKPPEPKHKPGDGYMPGRAPTDPGPLPPPVGLPRDPKPNPFTPGGGDSLDPGKKPTSPTTRPPLDPKSGLPLPPTTPKAGGAQSSGGETPGIGGGRRTGASRSAPPWFRWETWWSLNRWSFFPARGELLFDRAVVTPSPTTGPKVDRKAVASARRALVTRQHIIPFLTELLDPKRRVRDEVRAAALIALAKVSHDEAALALVIRHAEDARASGLVRESAALAIGLARRSAPADQLSGARLDALRTRLLDLLDDEQAPDRTRSFAALAIGLLGDQPFGSAFTKDGRVITRALWERALRKHGSHDLPVSLLTAIGMQPRGGTADGIRDDLLRIVHGRRIGRRAWDAHERSHALAALVRQEGDGWPLALFRVLTAKRVPAPVRQAAFIALGAKGAALDAAERLDAVEAAEKGLRLSRDNLTRGLGLIALGRLVRADIAAGSTALVERTGACGLLLGEARHGAHDARGFAALALGIAVRRAVSSDLDVVKFVAEGHRTLAQGFERTKDARTRSAYASALGLLGGDVAKETREALAVVLADRRTDQLLRGHAAVALAQMGDHSTGVRKALRTALWDRSSVELRSRAALGLSFLGGRAETRMLVQELRNARSQWVLQQIAVALGQLGDVGAVPDIVDVAADARRADEVRALAIASLGLLGDPEPKPSLLRLLLDANYPARTNALHEAFSIL